MDYSLLTVRSLESLILIKKNKILYFVQLFDIFIKLLSLIHEKDIRTAAEFFQHAPEIYKFLFENKNLWGRITTNTLCDEYFETYAYLTVGVIYNKNKIKQLFAKPLAKKRRNVQL